MIKEFEPVVNGISTLVDEWEPVLLNLSYDVISNKRNSQNRTIKQIVGHLIDSASNNIHRIVHLQYQKSPFNFPNYATNGNNDRWIAIQNYQDEDWKNQIQLWKYINLHLAHVIQNIKPEKLQNEWIASQDKRVTLQEIVMDFLRHFKLHLNEIIELIDSK